VASSCQPAKPGLQPQPGEVMTKSLSYSLALAAALATGCFAANAQQYSTSVALPGVPGVTTYNSVPEGFDPAAASDTELQEFGYPKRPDISDTKAYASWLRAVSVTRITPELFNSGRFHRPNQRVGSSTVVENTTHSNSGNWSGWSLIGGSPKFAEVVGLWVVPNVGNTKSGVNGYMSEWVGIDGNCKCNDLIQDGTEQQFTGGKASYYAWIEFIPESELIITNFPVAPGDVIYAYSAVGVKSGKTVGIYYIANYNTRKAVSATITIPPKTSFSGLSAEWIVERTEVNGSFNNPLPYYAYAYMDDAWAYRSGSSHAIDYTAEANENIVMVQGSTQLSKSFEQDADSMWFEWLNY
jgi:Peptidase A4 family